MKPLKQMSLSEKVRLLIRTYALKWGIIKKVWQARRLALNEYSKELLDDVPWQTISGIKFKKISDPQGEYRFYIPDFDPDAVYRVDVVYGRETVVPKHLADILLYTGRVNEEQYRKFWYHGGYLSDDNQPEQYQQ